MNGSNLVIDTNIALYLLSKDDTIAQLLNGKDIYISFITELELLGYKNLSPIENITIRDFISDCIVIDLNSEIKRSVINLRQKYSIKLPDSIIASTAIYLGLPFVTADKGFEKIKEMDILIYDPGTF